MSVDVEERLDSVEDELKRVDEQFSSFRKTVLGLRSRWDAELPVIRTRFAQLNEEVRVLRQQLDLLRAKREAGLIDEDTYVKVHNELAQKIADLSDRVDQLKYRLSSIDHRIRLLWARVLTEENIDVDVDGFISNVERLRSQGVIDDDEYARLRKDAEIIKLWREILARLRR